MLGVSDYGAFVLSFVLLLFLPGPGNLALVTSTSLGGWRGGLWSVWGLLLGDQVLLWLTVAGVAVLLQAQPALFTGLQWVGAAYLTWMGWRMMRPGSGASAPIQVRAGRYFVDTLLITVLNPKAVVFYFAFFPQFIDPVQHRGWLTYAFMAVTVWVLGALYCLGVVGFTHTMVQRMSPGAGLTLWLSRLAGVCLIGFGLRMFWSA